MAKTIQDLRRERGYRSAREFADALGISASSMSRYDNQPDSIPTKVAWAMADDLGCSIDEVVGREHVTSGRSDLQDLYDGLLPETRALVDELLEFARQRDEKARRQREQSQADKYDRLAMLYERMFTQAVLNQMDPDALVVFDQPWMMRDGVADLVEEKTEESRAKSARKYAEREMARMRAAGKFEKPGVDLGFEEGEPGFEEAYEDYLIAISKDYDNAHEGTAKEVTDKIMEAYDRRHADELRDWAVHTGQGDVRAILEYSSRRYRE